ncbi:MAG: redox-regulated ATPase YchF [Candidatus Curtissbacteria bacterium]
MNLSCGIVGLPNVGKSTLFNALLKKQVALAANYPFATIEPNVGVVEVPDGRLPKLAQMVANENSNFQVPNSKQIQNKNDQNQNKIGWPPIVPATVSFVDIAGLVKGAAAGEGLGNQFLSHIREVDVIVFVLRDFKNEDIVRSGSENPQSDLDVLKTELLIKDSEVIDKRIESLGRELRTAPPQDLRHLAFSVLQKAKQLAEEGKWLEDNLDNEELDKIKDLQLLSTKKSIVVLNCDEEDLKESVILGSDLPAMIRDAMQAGATPESDRNRFWTSQNDNIVRICAKTEEDLASLEPEEQKQYLAELGVAEPGLDILIRKAYETLGLITFFTAGPKEVHAWTIRKGSLAPQAAGAIHTDFERGFIAAEVIDWEELVGCGGWKNAKDQGKIKTIGKIEEIKDGFVVEFRFSV